MIKIAEKEREETSYWMEGFAFGLTDGVICVTGFAIGIAAATSDPFLVIISVLIAGIVDAFGNSIGFFISQSIERGVQIHETVDHGAKIRVHSKKEVWMSGMFSFLATILALIILLSPFLLLSINFAVTLTFSIGIVLSFILGVYVSKLSGDDPYKTGLRYVILTITGAAVSYLVGGFLKHLLIEHTIRT